MLIGMAFQLGGGGLMQFRHMLESIRDERWHDAAESIRQSTWAHQTPKRAIRLAYQLERDA